MSYWPQPVSMPAHQLTISSWSSLGMFCSAGPFTAPFSGASGAANRMFAFPFRLPRPMTARTAFWMNGASVAGNLIVGIYGAAPGTQSDGAEVKLVETASTALSGTNVIQSVAIGPQYLRPGLYYVAMITSGAPNFFRSSSALTNDAGAHLGNYRRDQGSFALPATLGTPNSRTFIIPVYGIAAQTVI